MIDQTTSAEIDETTALLIQARGLVERDWISITITWADLAETKAYLRSASTNLNAHRRSQTSSALDYAAEILELAIKRLEAIPRFDDQNTVESVLTAFDRVINQSRSGD